MGDFWASLIAAIVVLVTLSPLGYAQYVRARNTSRSRHGRFLSAGILLIAGLGVFLVWIFRSGIWRTLPLVIVLDGYFMALAGVDLRMARRAGEGRQE